jgi:hypothetical protein
LHNRHDDCATDDNAKEKDNSCLSAEPEDGITNASGYHSRDDTSYVFLTYRFCKRREACPPQNQHRDRDRTTNSLLGTSGEHQAHKTHNQLDSQHQENGVDQESPVEWVNCHHLEADCSYDRNTCACGDPERDAHTIWHITR